MYPVPVFGVLLAEPQTASVCPESVALSKDLKKRGWKFVGPTTVYAFMQAIGLINDHVEDCVNQSSLTRFLIPHAKRRQDPHLVPQRD